MQSTHPCAGRTLADIRHGRSRQPEKSIQAGALKRLLETWNDAGRRKPGDLGGSRRRCGRLRHEVRRYAQVNRMCKRFEIRFRHDGPCGKDRSKFKAGKHFGQLLFFRLAASRHHPAERTGMFPVECLADCRAQSLRFYRLRQHGRPSDGLQRCQMQAIAASQGKQNGEGDDLEGISDHERSLLGHVVPTSANSECLDVGQHFAIQTNLQP